MPSVTKVWRIIANLKPQESTDKLVTYHSWLVSPLLHLQANLHTCVQNGGAPLMPPPETPSSWW